MVKLTRQPSRTIDQDVAYLGRSQDNRLDVGLAFILVVGLSLGLWATVLSFIF